jgi:hypothetical protein
MPTSDYAVQGFFSTSSSSPGPWRASDVQGEGDAHIHRCVGLHVCKLERYCQSITCFEVGDGFDVLVQVHVTVLVQPFDVLVQVHVTIADRAGEGRGSMLPCV